MDEKTYLDLVDQTLETLADTIESADKNAMLDVECQHGILTIDMPGGRQLLVSRHLPSKQIWLASPISGGLHFIYDKDGDKQWKLQDGRTLGETLVEETTALCGLELKF